MESKINNEVFMRNLKQHKDTEFFLCVSVSMCRIKILNQMRQTDHAFSQFLVREVVVAQVATDELIV